MKIAFYASLVLAFTVGFTAMGCKNLGGLGNEVKTGVTAAGEVCTFINEFLDNGVLATICATANEIAKWGARPAVIAAHRREMSHAQ